MSYLSLSVLMAVLILSAACSQDAPDVARSQSVTEADERSALAEASGLYQPSVATELLDCQSSADMTVHCGYQNPEDLVALPGNAFLIVSEMGASVKNSPISLTTRNWPPGRATKSSGFW